jgi:hypothetical protein
MISMPCPPEISAILADLLRDGLLRIRSLGWNHDADRCAALADHLHNLPALFGSYSPELLAFYWRIERAEFISRSSEEDIAIFEPTWARLAKYVPQINDRTLRSAI